MTTQHFDEPSVGNLLSRSIQPSEGHTVVVGVQIGSAQVWDPKKHHTGIAKKPVSALEVADPGPRDEGGRSGVAGDFVGDEKHHGGSDKAVYLFSREQLDYWQTRLGRTFAAGSFGENITTSGIDIDHLVVGTRLRIGTALLEASMPRIPCRTFAWHLQEQGWMKTFTEHGRSGTYVRVVTPGRITAGDAIEVTHVPTHGLTIVDLFRARLGDKDLLARVVDARVLSAFYQAEYEKYLGRVAQ